MINKKQLKLKKGFTIVELVIVIAVIAILAAVLIPTFTNIVEKANQSAAVQAARNAVTNMELEEDGQVPDGTYYIKSGNYYVTFENGQIDASSATKTAPAALGGRLYEGVESLNNVEVYKVGVVSFTLRTTSSADSTYNGQNGERCSISLSANNVITVTVNGALVKTTSSQGQGGAYWVGITLPVGAIYNNDTENPIPENDQWLYIKAEDVVKSPKYFTLKVGEVEASYTVKVVLGASGSFAPQGS